MKRFLGLILGLVPVNLIGSLAFYEMAKLQTNAQKAEILLFLKEHKEDLSNVAIIELLLKKFPDVNYSSLISQSLADKQANLIARLAPSSPTSAATPEITWPITLSSSTDLNNLATIEYQLRLKFGKSYKELIDTKFKAKQQELQNLLNPAAKSAPISVPKPTLPAGSTAFTQELLAKSISYSSHAPVTPSTSAPKTARPGGAPNGGAGGPASYSDQTINPSLVGTASTVDPKVQKYVDMVKNRATDEEILAALMAPQPVTKETLQALIPEDSKQDINNMKVLDYLLRTKYSQPQATLDKMYPYFKIIDIKRHLLPEDLKHYGTKLQIMEIPHVKPNQKADFPNNARKRSQLFGRNWIEFPSPTMKRHLDYNVNLQNKRIWLLRSDVWKEQYNDYESITHYNDVVNYYWNPDGTTFTLVYQDGTYQSYKGKDGTEVSERVKLPTEEIIIDISAEPEDEPPASPLETASEAHVITVQNKEKAIKEKQQNETETHFRARQRAKLNTQGKFGISDNPTTVLAQAIWGLDNSFTGLKDSDIAILRDYNQAESKDEINNLLDRNPHSTSLLDQAKVYIAIHSNWVNESDARVAEWNKFLEAIEAGSTGMIGIGTMAKVKLMDGIKLNNDIFVQTIAQYPTLTTEQQGILAKPGKYLRSLDRLLKEDPITADVFTKAKLNLILRSQWIDEDAPENAVNMSNINKWKDALKI